MQNLRAKLRWFLFRHPILYYVRFYLYKRKYNKSLIDNECYNSYNRKKDIPKIFHAVNETISLDSNSKNDKAIDLAKEIRLRIHGGRGLGFPSGKALEIMIKGEGGTCSDITQAYNNFCILNDIKIREWGIIDKIYDARFGHAFNEYYSEELHKWVLVDNSKCIYFIDPKTNKKLSALEVFDSVKAGETISYVSFLPNPELEFNKGLDESVDHINLHPNRLPSLIANYHIKFYDRLLNAFQSWLPTFMIHFMAVPIFMNVRFILVRNKSAIQ